MAPGFGTSGLRGLVTDLTDTLVRDYVNAFLTTCPHGGAVYIGQDLRPSSPRIASVVNAAVVDAGLTAVACGALPTPALAQAAMAAGRAAIMVTGSHIPADRNGLKFYAPRGEITKADEAAMLSARGAGHARKAGCGSCIAYVATGRYTDWICTAFGTSLAGLRIGVYRHSSVSRDVMEQVLARLGATVVSLGHSDVFIPVDTEAVDPDTRELLAAWCRAHELDAVVSTDGDGDRPMVADAQGRIVPGDTLGVLTAQYLGARVVVTPISSNDMVNRLGFDRVETTRIGSPFVIAAMEEIRAADPAARVVGFEANGGFLLGFDAGGLAPLMTRDGLLPIVAPLAAAQEAGRPLADLVAALPRCFTATDRVQEIDRDRAAAFLRALDHDPGPFTAATGTIAQIDRTDGLRLRFMDGRVLHFRTSGNAPEFRIYAQGPDPETARSLVAAYRDRVAERVL